uniref:Uncharacterized protein n=1 Tax=Globisporangium ultimum (strain ATCC 200006 / CBS 805.95 / DAOM BR144) TaxID=431595 RepID=K3X9L2_GLOUD
MALTSEYSGWVRELDTFEAGGDVREGDYDPRHESTTHPGAGLTSRKASRTSIGIGTSRKTTERALSQADELQQEMKLLNWHKLANEAALKVAIIKTNKIKRDDSHLSKSMTHEEMEDKQLRIQQIIEEEQLRPLEVNSEFFREFESKELRDEAKLEDDVQRHVQHLKRLKESMAQREDLQRRRQKYREGMLELNGGNSRSNSVPKSRSSNQEEDIQDYQLAKHHQRSNSMYNSRSGGGANHSDVICSLDKLMELEKRIRHLEDAGLGADALQDDPRIEHGGNDMEHSNAPISKRGIHFSKRQSTVGPHEPSQTVYAVTKSSAANVNKARAKGKPRSVTAAGGTIKQRPTNNRTQETFLTSLPESKQRQLRRMNERERRQFLKREKAGEEREKTLKQDIVIDGWLDKKRQAANNRKASSNHVRAGVTGGTAVNHMGGTTTSGRRLGGKALPPAPKVRAPAVGAASGKRISNSHLQKFDDIKKGFEKRNESLKQAPTNLRTGNGLLDSRTSSGSSHFPRHSSNANNTQKSSATKLGSTLSSTATQRTGVLRGNPSASGAHTQSGKYSTGLMGKGLLPTAPNKKTPSSVSYSSTLKLPAITPPSGAPSALTSSRNRVPQFGISNMNPTASMHPAQKSSSQKVTGRISHGATLPRLSGQTRGLPAPSPPPLSLKNANMPQFSRLHKR